MNVEVSPKNATSTTGGTKQFTATVTNALDTSVTWSSSDLNVVTIDQTGLATVESSAAVGEVSTITATSNEDSSKTGNSTLTVI